MPALALTDQMKSDISSGMDTGHVLLLGAVGPDGKPLLSFRGSAAAFSDTAIGFWARKTDSATLVAIRANPNVAMMFRSPSVPMLQFIGRARVTDSPAERARVFDLSHPKEQARDPERTGTAVIVELEAITGIQGVNADGPIPCNMHRGYEP